MVEIEANKARLLAQVRKIVVHGGLAHVDDIMACAIAYAFGVPHDAAVERRNPTADELASPAAMVLDVGGLEAPERLDFDHHQRPRELPPKCAYVLLSEWLGVDAELKLLFPWYETWNLVDVLGPFAAAQAVGSTWSRIEGLVENPLADFVIRRFADDPAFRNRLALSLARGIELTRKCWRALEAKVTTREIAGLKVGDFTACETTEISRASDIWVRVYRPACLVSKDNRGPGLTLLRCHDDPRLDFTRCARKPYAAFAHPGGFLLKTRTRTDDVETALADALVQPSDRVR